MSSDENDLIKAEAARYKRATDAAAKSRATLTELVIDALREPDAKPADIARRADWTAAYVRKLARDNGIQADPAYKARTEKARATLLAQVAEATPAPKQREQPSPPTAEQHDIVSHLSDHDAGKLAGRAFAQADPQQFKALTDAANNGNHAVVQAALDCGALTKSQVLAI